MRALALTAPSDAAPSSSPPHCASQSGYPWLKLNLLRVSHKRAAHADVADRASKRGRDASSSQPDADAEEVARGTGPPQVSECSEDDMHPVERRSECAHESKRRDAKLPAPPCSVPPVVAAAGASGASGAPAAPGGEGATIRETDPEVAVLKAAAAAEAEARVHTKFLTALHQAEADAAAARADLADSLASLRSECYSGAKSKQARRSRVVSARACTHGTPSAPSPQINNTLVVELLAMRTRLFTSFGTLAQREVEDDAAAEERVKVCGYVPLVARGGSLTFCPPPCFAGDCEASDCEG